MMEEILKSEEEYLIKANEYLLDWDFLRAHRVLTELLEEEPCCGKAHAMMGEIKFFIQNEPISALRHFKLAIQYTPNNFKPYTHFITVAKSMGKYKDAIIVIDIAYSIFFDQRDQLILYKAEIYEQQRKWKKSKVYYERALELSLNPNLESQMVSSIKRVTKKLKSKKGKKKK